MDKRDEAQSKHSAIESIELNFNLLLIGTFHKQILSIFPKEKADADHKALMADPNSEAYKKKNKNHAKQLDPNSPEYKEKK